MTAVSGMPVHINPVVVVSGSTSTFIEGSGVALLIPRLILSMRRIE